MRAACGSISSSTESIPSPLGRAGHVAKAWKTKPRGAEDSARSQQQGRISAQRQPRAGDSPAAKGRGGGCAGSWSLSLAPFGALRSGISVPSAFPKAMETRSSTCRHPPPHPVSRQSSRNAQNPQLTPSQEILAAVETSSPKTIVFQSPCESREEETSLPLRPHPAEQRGASWEQSSGCVLGTGRAGKGVSFLKRKAWGGCFFLFYFFFLWVWVFFSVLTKNVNETRTVPRKRTYTDQLISCLGEVTMEILRRSYVHSCFF